MVFGEGGEGRGREGMSCASGGGHKRSGFVTGVETSAPGVREEARARGGREEMGGAWWREGVKITVVGVASKKKEGMSLALIEFARA